MYDIANVFLALGIIKKAYLQTRKPAFSWVGLDGLAQVLNKLLYGSSSSQKDKKQLSVLFSDKFNIDLQINELLGQVVLSKPIRAVESVKAVASGLDLDLPTLQSTNFVSKKSAFSICPNYFKPFEISSKQGFTSSSKFRGSSCKSIKSNNSYYNNKFTNTKKTQKTIDSATNKNQNEFTPIQNSSRVNFSNTTSFKNKQCNTIEKENIVNTQSTAMTLSMTQFKLHTPHKITDTFNIVPFGDITNLVNSEANIQNNSNNTNNKEDFSSLFNKIDDINKPTKTLKEKVLEKAIYDKELETEVKKEDKDTYLSEKDRLKRDIMNMRSLSNATLNKYNNVVHKSGSVYEYEQYLKQRHFENMINKTEDNQAESANRDEEIEALKETLLKRNPINNTSPFAEIRSNYSTNKKYLKVESIALKHAIKNFNNTEKKSIY